MTTRVVTISSDDIVSLQAEIAEFSERLKREEREQDEKRYADAGLLCCMKDRLRAMKRLLEADV